MGIFTITNYTFSVTLRMIRLWKERGFGSWLLGSLWAATYNLLLLPTTVVKNIIVFNKEQAEKALPMKAMDGLELGASSNVIQLLQGGTTESNHDKTRKPSSGGTYKAVDSPYYSVSHQLEEARKTLTRQQEEAAYKLAGVHRHYEGLLTQYATERPSASDG
jgi:putative lipoic acid-binding regulatory protein